MSTRAPLPHLSPGTGESGPAAPSAFAWKDELNARLREHRQRRATQDEPSRSSAVDRPTSGVAARVAERYSAAPSYSDLIAVSAAAASAAGNAAAAALEAHAAARAVLSEWDAQAGRRSMPDAIAPPASDVFDDPFFAEPSRARWEETAAVQDQPAFNRAASDGPRSDWPAPAGAGPSPAAAPAATEAYRVAHHAPLPQPLATPERTPGASRARALIDAFAESVVPAAAQLPTKLIEFPRELIAGRKQRPRLAEGPLAEAPAEPGPGAGGLRIFEVETAQTMAAGDSMAAYAAGHAPHDLFVDETMSRRDEDDELEQTARRRAAFELEPENGPSAAPSRPTPGAHAEAQQPAARAVPRRTTPMTRASATEDVAPLWKGRQPEPQTGWSSIRLSEHPQPAPEQAGPSPRADRLSRHPSAAAVEASPAAARAPHAFEALASIADRALAALMDVILVFASFLVGLLVFASCTTHTPSGKGAVAIGVVALSAMGVFYGWLFMSYGGGSTPGMRYARIALCTFENANPTRKELQNRIPATALALLPLGLGLIWALMDEDRLGWHDRMTRTYQRSYR